MVIPVCLCSFGLQLAPMNKGATATVNERREFTFTEIINGAFRNARFFARGACRPKRPTQHRAVLDLHYEPY